MSATHIRSTVGVVHKLNENGHIMCGAKPGVDPRWSSDRWTFMTDAATTCGTCRRMETTDQRR